MRTIIGTLMALSVLLTMVRAPGSIGAPALMASPGLEAQGPVTENVVSLSVHLDVRALNYTAAKPEIATILFDATIPPIQAIVGIGNNTDQRLDVGTSQRNWTQALSFSVYRRDRSRIEDVTAKAVIRRPSRGARPSTLEPGKFDRSAFLIALGDIPTQSSDQYELVVALDDSVLSSSARRLPNLLTRRIRFGIRQARTDLELADAYLQLSYQGLASGRLADTRQWAQRVLTLNPESVPALTDLAGAWLAEGNCAQAVPLLQRSLKLLSAGADPALRMSDFDREEWAAGLRSQLGRCR